MPHDPKSRPSHSRYLQVLDRLGPMGRLEKAMELSDLAKDAFKAGLRAQYPDLSEQAFHRLFLSELAKCHNRNY